MASHTSIVDDPEKHFLGNLLEEDSSHNPTSLNTGSSSTLGTIPPVSVISGAGPISGTNSLFRSYWPEPPPPYSPPTQNPLKTPWYSSEGQSFLKSASSDYLFPSGQKTFITHPQIHHHHHHSLHHHTYTHNVVENHHHYPIATVTLPSLGYSLNAVSEDPPSFRNVLKNDEDHYFSSETLTKCAAQKGSSRERLLSSTTLLPSKLPLSYRDVAARNDQITGSEGIRLAQAKNLQSYPNNGNRANFSRAREIARVEHSKIARTKGDRKSKSEQPVEFQKITRKKVAPKKDKIILSKTFSSDSVSLPAIGQNSSVPTKYEVLQKLSSMSCKRAPSNEIVSKREREPVRVAMVTERSRSSSFFPVSDEGTVVDVAARPKRAVDVAEKKKQSSSNINQSQQRRRPARKRNEYGWMDKAREEALERFLCSAKCQDAYGVLGLRSSCTEEDVRRHYKKLSALLNPDKNPLEGAEEAYEMVTKAYQVLSTPESRKTYNFHRIRPYHLHHEIGEMWNRIRERVEDARNSMFCDCGRRHARIALDIRQSEARYCRRCKTRHPARTNDIWVETRLCGFLWVYLTCCDGIVYDITDWATCEANYLKHVRPNSHTVQYRLVTPSAPSSGKPSNTDSSSQHHHSDKMRDLTDVADEFRPEWGRPGHAQISYLPLEPRDEDRSRRAANRRQKKWR